MASKKSYSDEVWNMLRLVWESSPKITWQALADQVSEKLGREVPASSVIRRRAISEGWKKNISSLVGKDAKSLNDEIEKQGGHKNSHDNDPVKSDTQKNDSECQNDIKNDNQRSKKSKTKINDVVIYDSESAGREKLIHDIKERKLSAAKVVRKTRNNLAKLSHFITDTLDSLGGVRDELQSMDVMTAGEAEINAIKFKMSVTSQMIEQNLKQSITIANVARTEAMFW